ncbi:MAG: hypothetical protein ACI304_08150, partial [Lepagella sp.]
ITTALQRPKGVLQLMLTFFWIGGLLFWGFVLVGGWGEKIWDAFLRYWDKKASGGCVHTLPPLCVRYY